MFDSTGSPQVGAGLTDLDDAGVVDVISAAARDQNAMCAQELAGIGELYARRAPEDDSDRINWAIDGHENVVAEVAAALGSAGVGRGGGCAMRSRCGSACRGWRRCSGRGPLIFG